MYDLSNEAWEREEEAKAKHKASGKEGIFWNNGPSIYYHVPFGVRISDYGACKTLEVEIPWNPSTRFYRVDELGRSDSYYGTAVECATHIGCDRRTIKKKAKTGGLYRRKYSVGEVDFRTFMEATGRTHRKERQFAERY